VNLKDSYVKIINGEIYLINCHISPYEQGNIFNHDPLRQRKLLMHRKEIDQLLGKVQEKGLALTATKMYIKARRVKVQVALARGKKLYDKRQSIKEKDLKREMERDFKGR
ncbi:MAG: SsrA-binding protein SmpB, partial [Deferribacterales bacterium]|nr:SsrA-binding protein SmpB [Deferribacterales bacterium]